MILAAGERHLSVGRRDGKRDSGSFEADGTRLGVLRQRDLVETGP